ncbi:unnamed protein product, partial [Rotaria sp. Silwood2]
AESESDELKNNNDDDEDKPVEEVRKKRQIEDDENTDSQSLEVAGGVVQHLVHQIQHQPQTSSSSQRASTSMSALR